MSPAISSCLEKFTFDADACLVWILHKEDSDTEPAGFKPHIPHISKPVLIKLHLKMI